MQKINFKEWEDNELEQREAYEEGLGSFIKERNDGDWDCSDCGNLVYGSNKNCRSCGGT